MNREQRIKLVKSVEQSDNKSITFVSGYRVNFKMPEKFKNINLSIEAGQKAIKQWSSGAPILLLKGACYSTKMIASIEQRKDTHSSGYRNSVMSKEFIEGNAVLLQDADKQLQELLSGESKLELEKGTTKELK